jgi:hypothetical protein
MTPMELVLIAFGGNVMLLAVLGYLAKSLMSQLLAKDLKHFETKLSQASAVAAEELKHSLSLVAHEHHVRFSHLHDKQAIVLEDIYAKLLEFEDASAALTLANNDTPENLMEFALNRAQDAGRELAQYIRKKEIYLPAAVSTQLHSLLDRVNSLLSSCSFNLLSKKLASDGKPDLFPEAKQAWTTVHQYLEHEAPSLRHSLESDFRKRLGAEVQ